MDIWRMESLWMLRDDNNHLIFQLKSRLLVDNLCASYQTCNTPRYPWPLTSLPCLSLLCRSKRRPLWTWRLFSEVHTTISPFVCYSQFTSVIEEDIFILRDIVWVCPFSMTVHLLNNLVPIRIPLLSRGICFFSFKMKKGYLESCIRA